MKLKIDNKLLVIPGIVPANYSAIIILKNGTKVTNYSLSVEGEKDPRIFIHRFGEIVSRVRFGENEA